MRDRKIFAYVTKKTIKSKGKRQKIICKMLLKAGKAEQFHNTTFANLINSEITEKLIEQII